MQTHFKTNLITNHLPDGKYIQLFFPFIYYSELLGQEVEIPKDFICDLESVPIIKSPSKRAGTIHDYFCRKDSIPIVTKQQAADLYLEAQAHRDSLMFGNYLTKFYRLVCRQFKTAVVRITPGYFHKFNVLSTIEELTSK
jgi:hypothetical protein